MKLLFLLCFGLLTNCKILIADEQVVANNGRLISKNTTTSVTSKPSVAQISTTSRPFAPGFKLPCSCAEGQCGCCSGPILGQFNQKACLNMTYEPDDFALTTTMSMNRRVLFKRTVSDMEANWQDITLVEWSFDCIRMGASGVAVVGEEEGGGVPGNPIDAVDQTDEDYDDSARNVDLVIGKQYGSLIFDPSLEKFDKTRFNKKFVKVQRLPNGDVRVGYKNDTI